MHSQFDSRSLGAWFPNRLAHQSPAGAAHADVLTRAGLRSRTWQIAYTRSGSPAHCHGLCFRAPGQVLGVPDRILIRSPFSRRCCPQGRRVFPSSRAGVGGHTQLSLTGRALIFSRNADVPRRGFRQDRELLCLATRRPGLVELPNRATARYALPVRLSPGDLNSVSPVKTRCRPADDGKQGKSVSHPYLSRLSSTRRGLLVANSHCDERTGSLAGV